MKKQKLIFSSIVWYMLLWVFWFVQAQSLWDIDLRFCENYQEKQVDIVTNSDQDTNICVLYKNNADTDVTLNIGFVDGIVNSSWWKSCGIPSDPNLNFAQFVKDYDTELTIPAHEEIKQHYTIHYPAGFSWLSHGCITYDIKKKDSERAGWMITLVFRKTFSIDILVWWSQVKTNLSIKNLSVSGDEVSQQILLELINGWNTDQDISLTWEISNWFGYKQDFSITGTKISASDDITVSSTNITIPSYKWLFFIKSNLKNIPVFDFDITNTKLQTEYSLPGTTIISNVIILWNRLYIVLSWIVILLLIFVIVKLAKMPRKIIVRRREYKQQRQLEKMQQWHSKNNDHSKQLFVKRR